MSGEFSSHPANYDDENERQARMRGFCLTLATAITAHVISVWPAPAEDSNETSNLEAVYEQVYTQENGCFVNGPYDPARGASAKLGFTLKGQEVLTITPAAGDAIDPALNVVYDMQTHQGVISFLAPLDAVTETVLVRDCGYTPDTGQ